MTNPVEPGVPVPEKVSTAAKAINAGLVSLAGLAGLVYTLTADGSVSGTDVGAFVAAVLSALAGVGVVYQTQNRVKN